MFFNYIMFLITSMVVLSYVYKCKNNNMFTELIEVISFYFISIVACLSALHIDFSFALLINALRESCVYHTIVDLISTHFQFALTRYSM